MSEDLFAKTYQAVRKAYPLIEADHAATLSAEICKAGLVYTDRVTGAVAFSDDVEDLCARLGPKPVITATSSDSEKLRAARLYERRASNSPPAPRPKPSAPVEYDPSRPLPEQLAPYQGHDDRSRIANARIRAGALENAMIKHARSGGEQ